MQFVRGETDQRTYKEVYKLVKGLYRKEDPDKPLKEIKREARDTYRHLQRCEHWVTDTYHVALDKETEHGFTDLLVWHLSIKRHDREPIGDWRILQSIKTAIAGPECEAIELYPAESRVVDTANQYHLYAFVGAIAADGTVTDFPRFPVGMGGGMRTDNPGSKARNRPGSARQQGANQ